MKTNNRRALLTRTRAGVPPEAIITLRVHTFGAAAIEIDGDAGATRLGPAAGTQFSLLLLLVHAPGMQLPAAHVLSTLWPDAPEARRRGNLRQTLYRLRRLGVRVTLAGPDVCLDSSQVSRNFSVERSAERFDADVTRGNDPFGQFLPGFAPKGSPALREWLEGERAVAHADVRRVLVAQLRLRRERADWGGAAVLARWLLQFDALNEDATLTLAEYTALSGAKHEALGMIDRYLADLGPQAGDIRVPATTLRRRIAEPSPRRLSFAPTERHFFGRDEELRDLTLTMRRARWHDGSATLLHGPAGMGKTRLTEELAKIAVLEGIREVRAGCRESDVTRPLSIFLDLVPELLAMPGALGCSPEGMRCLRRFANEESTENSPSEGEPHTITNSAGSRRRAIVGGIL